MYVCMYVCMLTCFRTGKLADVKVMGDGNWNTKLLAIIAFKECQESLEV